MRPSANVLLNYEDLKNISAGDFHSLISYPLLIAASSLKINVFINDNVGGPCLNMLGEEQIQCILSKTI